MKKLNKLSFVNNNKTSAIIALLIVSLIILGCGGKPDMPNDSAVQSLVKTTMSDFGDAIDKGDFKAFREKSSKDFQDSFTEAQLKTTFQPYITNKETNVPLLRKAAVGTPTFSPAPALREEKGNYILVANGNIPIEGEDISKVPFETEYIWRDGAWKLLKIKL